MAKREWYTQVVALYSIFPKVCGVLHLLEYWKMMWKYRCTIHRYILCAPLSLMVALSWFHWRPCKKKKKNWGRSLSQISNILLGVFCWLRVALNFLWRSGQRNAIFTQVYIWCLRNILYKQTDIMQLDWITSVFNSKLCVEIIKKKIIKIRRSHNFAAQIIPCKDFHWINEKSELKLRS